MDAILRLAYVRQHVERYAKHVIALSPLAAPPELGVEIRRSASDVTPTPPTAASGSKANGRPPPSSDPSPSSKPPAVQAKPPVGRNGSPVVEPTVSGTSPDGDEASPTPGWVDM